MSTFWFVDVLVCRRFGLSTFRSVDDLVCRCFGLSTFWFVDVSVCRRFGLSTFRYVDVSVCRRFGCRRLGLSTFWLVTIIHIKSNTFQNHFLFKFTCWYYWFPAYTVASLWGKLFFFLRVLYVNVLCNVNCFCFVTEDTLLVTFGYT